MKTFICIFCYILVAGFTQTAFASQDNPKIADSYIIAADKYSNNDMFKLGLTCENKEDYTMAMHYYLKAAQLSDVRAMLRLGALYDNGLGVAKDSTEAMKWYRKAAETIAISQDSKDEPASETISSDIKNQSKRRQWFTEKSRVFDPLLADPREAKVSIGYLKDKHGDSFLDMGFGGDAPLLYEKISGDSEMSVTVRGLISSRFQFFSDSFDMLNTDFIGGVALGKRKQDKSMEFFLYHQSSHLGDESLEQGERKRIDYSRETFRFLYSKINRKGLRFYGGPSFNLRSDPEKIENKLTLQVGSEYQFTFNNLPMYTALDLQSKQENNWDINLDAQIGLNLGDRENVFRRQRLFIELFNGFSNMGQFYDERELFVRFGIQLVY